MSEATLRRTQLATPASDEQMLSNATESAADEVFLDLEVSATPSAKGDAREPPTDAAREHDWNGTIVEQARPAGIL